MTPPGFMAIAHRGASSYAPENTCAAFDLAIAMGARHIELDVHFSSDGHLVVIHDDAVNRTTNGSGPVTGHSLAALTASFGCHTEFYGEAHFPGGAQACMASCQSQNMEMSGFVMSGEFASSCWRSGFGSAGLTLELGSVGLTLAAHASSAATSSSASFS